MPSALAEDGHRRRHRRLRVVSAPRCRSRRCWRSRDHAEHADLRFGALAGAADAAAVDAGAADAAGVDARLRGCVAGEGGERADDGGEKILHSSFFAGLGATGLAVEVRCRR